MQFNFATVMLQAGGAQPGGGMMPIFLMVGMFVVMYFFMIRPQAKKAKEQKSFAESISAGEEIVTTAGIHARINRVNENGTLQLEISRGTFMTVERSAVSMEMTAAARKKTDAATATPVVAAK
jgi:preprotein translocase subunit YajC